MSEREGGLDYASSGVDIDLEGASVASLVGALARSVRPAGSPGAPVDLPGGFGGLVEFGDNLLALATDGVGSKLQIASIMGDYSGVGIDCMAMNVNDLLCVGAEPIAFVDYIAVPKPDPDQHAAIGASLAEACTLARVTLAGGETASLPGIVTELDLSGTALGWLPKGAAITGENLAADDVMIGLPASGIHSNGFSLVRKVVEVSGLSYTDRAPFANDKTLGEVLLTPTRIYVDPVTDLIDACRAGTGPCPADALHAICHVTGGGLSNLLRLHGELGWHISNPLPQLAEFEWIQTTGGISDREMARTFNLGMGMVIVVAPQHASEVEDWLAVRLHGCRAVGEVVDHGHKVTHVNPEILFEHY
jgi:phosphoribosylformylglycinamidine cyclo-ligase